MIYGSWTAGDSSNRIVAIFLGANAVVWPQVLLASVLMSVCLFCYGIQIRVQKSKVLNTLTYISSIQNNIPDENSTRPSMSQCLSYRNE